MKDIFKQVQADRKVNFTSHAAIYCKYHGPTNYRGTRISVRMRGDKGEKATYYPYCYELELWENFEQRARNYADKINWSGNLVGAMACDGAVFIFPAFKRTQA